MITFTNLLRKIRRALDYICLNNLRVDGMEHLIAGILVVSMAQWFFSVWTAIALTLFILVGKEIIYDKWLRQGVPEWRDVFWGAVGMVLGLMWKKSHHKFWYIKNYAFLCGERHNIIIFGKISRTDFVQDIKNPSKVAERKQSATSMPCVCCDVHTYGGFLFITIR